jgi:tRNA 2-thiouridine synthesizing protein A
MTQSCAPDLTIDITAELCPMTYVRTRLALDRLKSGEVLAVMLRGAEPVLNVPRTAAAQGHKILGQWEQADGNTLVFIQKG